MQNSSFEIQNWIPSAFGVSMSLLCQPTLFQPRSSTTKSRICIGSAAGRGQAGSVRGRAPGRKASGDAESRAGGNEGRAMAHVRLGAPVRDLGCGHADGPMRQEREKCQAVEHGSSFRVTTLALVTESDFHEINTTYAHRCSEQIAFCAFFRPRRLRPISTLFI